MFRTIDRYLLREVLTVLVAILSILMLVITSMLLLRILEEANLGALNPNQVLRFLTLQVGRDISAILPPAFFLAVLVSLGRMARHSEIIALSAGGVGLWRIYRALFFAALPLALATAWLALDLKPWVVKEIQILRQDQMERGYQIAGLQAGRFYQQFDGAVTLYIEELDEHRRLRNVFIHDRREPVERLVLSEEGFHRIDSETGDHLVTLLNGRRYDGNPGSADYSIGEFERYRIWIAPRSVELYRTKRSARPTRELIGSADPEARAELESRLAGPLAIFTLGLIAVPLSITSPRQRSTGRILIAFVTYLSFFNLQRLAESWLERGVTPLWLGSLWYQGLILAIVFVVLYSDSFWVRSILQRLRAA